MFAALCLEIDEHAHKVRVALYYTQCSTVTVCIPMMMLCNVYVDTSKINQY